MQSKTSLFNKTLYKTNITRCWPLYTIVSLLAGLIPTSVWLSVIRSHSDYMAAEFESMLYGMALVNVPIAAIYALVCASFTWQYLFNSRHTGMMHTIPATRTCLFITGTASGLTMLTIPYVFAGLISVLALMSLNVWIPGTVIKTVLYLFGENLFFFAFATFFAFVTGVTAAMPIFYGIGNFLAVATDALFTAFARGFLFGLTSDYTGKLEWFSPTVKLMTALEVNEQRPNVCSLDNAWIIGVYAAAGLVLLLISWAMYMNRKSESAGDVVAVGWLRPIFRYGLTVYAGLTGAMLVYTLLFDDFFSACYRPLPMTIILVICSLIGYYIACMFLSKNLRVFGKQTRTGAIAVAAAAVVLCAGLALDIAGVSSKVPAHDSIESVYCLIDSNSSTLYAGKDDVLIDKMLSLHKTIVDSKAEIMAEEAYYGRPGYNFAYRYIEFQYQLANGRSLSRRYAIRLNDPETEDTTVIGMLVDGLKHDPAYQRKVLHLDTTSDPNQYRLMEVNLAYLGSYEYLDPSLYEGIRKALSADAETVNMLDLPYVGNELSFEYEIRSPEAGRLSPAWYSYCSVSLVPEMVNTISFLEAHGLVDSEIIEYMTENPDEYIMR